MSAEPQQDLEGIAAELDRFLGAFYDSRGWRSEIKFDPAADMLYLVVRLADGRLSTDDRFLALVEHFTRQRGGRVRQGTGLRLEPRVYSSEGSEITAALHSRGGHHLDDDARAVRMRRRLVWLGLRRRLVRHILPGSLLWAGAMIFVVVVVGLPANLALLLAATAVTLQIVVDQLLRARRRQS